GDALPDCRPHRLTVPADRRVEPRDHLEVGERPADPTGPPPRVVKASADAAVRREAADHDAVGELPAHLQDPRPARRHADGDATRRCEIEMPPVEADQLAVESDVPLAGGEPVDELDRLADRSGRSGALDPELPEPREPGTEPQHDAAAGHLVDRRGGSRSD